jgi:HD-GYP domain-containing protein (c-di-GMP phosphodiesterase class II)
VSGLVKTYRRLLHLYNRGDEIRSSLDLQEVVAHLSRDATALARGEYGMVALFDEASGDMTLQATYEDAVGAVGYHTRRIEEWYLRRCAATNSPVAGTQPAAAYRQIFGPALDGEGRMLAVMCVPISMRDRTLGVLSVLRDAKRGGFAQEEIASVEALANQGVMAVEQAQLFTKVRSHADEIELSYDATLKALMAALDAKDEVTEGHCERVAKLTVQLARQMGIEDQALVDIERGALLHDVGKIGVPDAVLKKPKALNDLEWEAMRKHPLLAGLMVSKIGFLEGALPILLYHHERYDGQGYPFGLAGDAIPLEARVFMVIDAYDAMTSDRPYRAAMSHHEAMTEIASHNGKQFDPDVVRAFAALMSSRPELRHAGGTRVLIEHDDDEAVA